MFKNESSYLPQSCAIQPDLHADISSSTTKTKTLFVAENCRVPVRKPAGYLTSAELWGLIHFLEFNNLFDSRRKCESCLTDALGVKAPPRLTFPELTSESDCFPREVMPVDLSRTCKAALGTQASAEVIVKVDLEWMDSPDYKTSQVVFPQKEEEDGGKA